MHGQLFSGLEAERNYSDINEWNWLPTTENTDGCTRDTQKEQLNIRSRWFKGPKFLYGEKQNLPKISQAPKEIIGSYVILVTEVSSQRLPEIKSNYM